MLGAGRCCWAKSCVLSEFMSFSEEIFPSSFCSSGFCMLSVVSTISTPLLSPFYMCLPIPFPTIPARATSRFSPPLLLSAWICWISAIVIPMFCSLDKEAESSACWWLFGGGGVASSPLRVDVLL